MHGAVDQLRCDCINLADPAVDLVTVPFHWIFPMDPVVRPAFGDGLHRFKPVLMVIYYGNEPGR